MRVLIDLTTIVGLGFSGLFLAMFRPSSYRSPVIINALGLSITLFLIFLSTFLLDVLGGHFLRPAHDDVEQIIYLVLRIIGDSILVARVVMFLKFQRDYSRIRIVYDDKTTEA